MARLSVEGASGPVITLNGRRVVSFGGCNYLGLSWHPAVLAAMARGLERYGLSTSASRETTGNTAAHDELEIALREFLGTAAAVVMPDGYTANLAAAQGLAARHSAAVVDARSHRSIREAITCSGMTLHVYEHRNVGAAAEALKKVGGGTVWTDGVFAADGSVAPVGELLNVCREMRGKAVLVVDDCHGFCTLGRGGRGTLEHFGLEWGEDVVLTTTLAKGLGCHGGVVAGAAWLAEEIRARATAYVCTTPASPAIAEAAKEALEVVRREPERLARLRAYASALADGLKRAGVRVERGAAPVIAFTLETVERMKAVHAALLEAGYLAPLIDYPDGPAPAYFRVSVTSEHTKEQVEEFAAAVGRVAARCEEAVDSEAKGRTVGQTAG